MDVERIQKINNLALDLMRQGLAKDREDAIMQAEKIFSPKNSTQADSEFGSIRGRMVEPVQEAPRNNELSQDKIQQILAQNTQFLVKTIQNFQEKITLLENEITFLKNRPAQIVRETVQQNSTPSSQSAVSREAQQVAGQSHPRSGNYKDGDISIEKFFYMGNK
jgi:hypothetical protein